MAVTPDSFHDDRSAIGQSAIGRVWRRLSGGASRRFGGNRAVMTATALSLVWLGGVVAYAAGFFGLFESAMLAPRSASALEIALFGLAALAPITLFFYGALLAGKAEEIRAETMRLASAIDALRLSVSPRATPSANELANALTVAARAALAEEKEAMAVALARLDEALGNTQAMMDRLEGRESAARREGKIAASADAARPADRAQPALPLGGDAATPAPAKGVPWASVVRALNFPTDGSDRKGFAALREVVVDRTFAELLQAAEDTLNILAEDGLYMEDLAPEPATLEDWKRYAEGARGEEVSAVGGVRDEVALAIARGRLRQDPVFRDTALHFLRRYDRLVGRMAMELGDDPMILEAADSRTGRAFMIVARVTGVFD